MSETWPLALWHSLRLTGWLPALGTSALFALLAASEQWLPFEASPARLLEIILPLGVVWHMAFLFSPADEPPLELLLACPRPLAWLAGERIAVVAAAQTPLALVVTLGMALSGSADPLLTLALRWVVPSLALGALAFLITLASRQGAFGFLSALFMWLAWLIQGDAMAARWPVIRPFHLFLQPEAVSWQDYLVNRAALAALALFLTWRIGRLLGNEARLLGLKEERSWRMSRIQIEEPIP